MRVRSRGHQTIEKERKTQVRPRNRTQRERDRERTETYDKFVANTGLHRITTFRSTTVSINDGGPIIL